VINRDIFFIVLGDSQMFIVTVSGSTVLSV